jgi:hypothetical protein
MDMLFSHIPGAGTLAAKTLGKNAPFDGRLARAFHLITPQAV